MPKLKKVIVLTLLLVIMVTSVSFAEDDEGGVKETWFSKILTSSFGAIFNAMADALLSVVPKAEEIYMPKSPFMFSFSSENIFGAFTSKAYPMFKLIASIMVSPALLIAFMGLMTSKSGLGRNDSLASVKTLFLAVTAMWFFPNLVDFVLEQRDILSQAISDLFNMGEFTGFVDSMKTLAKSDEAKLLDTVVYLGSAAFSVWLMFNYIGLTFGFSILFLYAPISLVLTPAQFGKKIFSEFGKDFAGYALTPLLDITLLGVVTTIRTISANDLGMTPIAYNLISIALIFLVIPTRSNVKKKLGFGNVMGDMMGTSLAMGAFAMMSRAGKGSSQGGRQYSDSGNSRENFANDKPDYESQASYHRDLDALNMSSSSPREVRGGVPSLYDPAVANDVSSNNSMSRDDFMNNHQSATGGGASNSMSREDFRSNQESSTGDGANNSMSREDFLSKHQGKSYFKESDIGGLSNSEKAAYYDEKATEQKFQDYEAQELAREQQNKRAIKNGVKTAAKVTGAMAGASMGIFGGSKGVMVGAMAGGAIGKKVGNTATNLGGVVKAYNDTKEGPGYGSWFKKSSENLESNLESGFVSSSEFAPSHEMGDVEYINAEPVDDSIKGFPSTEAFDHTVNVKEANVKRALDQNETQSNEVVGKLMDNVKDRSLNVLTEKNKKALENCSYEDYPKISHNFKVEYENVSNAADMTYERFKEKNSNITKENFSIIVEKMEKNDNKLNKVDFSEAGERMKQQQSETLLNIVDDVKKETGIDIGQYMDYFMQQ